MTWGGCEMINEAVKVELAGALVSYLKEHYNYFGVGTSNVSENTPTNDLFSPIEWQEGTGIYRKQVEDIVFDGNNIIFKCKLRYNEFNPTSGQIYEVGIFNRLMGGQMLLRTVFSTPITKNNLTELTIDVKMKIW